MLCCVVRRSDSKLDETRGRMAQRLGYRCAIASALVFFCVVFSRPFVQRIALIRTSKWKEKGINNVTSFFVHLADRPGGVMVELYATIQP